MIGAQPTDHISPAPSGPVPWTFRSAGENGIRGRWRKVTVRARSFFEARDLACLSLKCGRDEVKLVGSVPLLSKLLRK